MKLSVMPNKTVPETRIIIRHQLLNDGHGRIYTFDYPNYKLDQRPRVLVLGYWKNPDTGNKLLGGINLNYLTEPELQKLRVALPLILRPKDLKNRYNVGKRILPDIFGQFYRTYNKSYVQQITPSELTYGKDKKEKDTDKTRAGLDASTIKKTIDSIEPSAPKPVSGKTGLDKGIPIRKLAKLIQRKKKLDTRDKQQQDIDQAEKQEVLAKKDLATQEPEEQPEEPQELPPEAPEEPQVPPEEPVEQPDSEKKKAADELSRPPNQPATEHAIQKHPILGFLWPSPDAYRTWHRPSAFLTTPMLSEGKEKPLLAIYNINTGETLIDRVEDHAVIIQEAGWDYPYIIRLLPVTGRDNIKRIVPLHDSLSKNDIRAYLRRVPAIVIDHLLHDN